MKDELTCRLYFFVGTTAELIKLMPVMQTCNQHGLPFRLIASGQNDITQSELLKYCGKDGADLVLHDGPIRKSALGLFLWFIKRLLTSAWRLRRVFGVHKRGEAVLIVHGDTVSTVMGSLLGKLYGLKVAHVEAGLRSFDYFHPFPEEIDRAITSRLADIHFCPNSWAVANLNKFAGVKIDTCHNTLLDALAIAQAEMDVSPIVKQLRREPYFVFVMHRQENLFNDELVKVLTEKVIQQSKKDHCVFVLHHLTEVALDRLGLRDTLRMEPTITTMRRLPYVEFVQLLSGAEYVVTDGGSNQEECYYLGKPCLVLRKVTERTEGLGHNVLLSKLDLITIDDFLNNPMLYKKPPVTVADSPSQIIARYLAEFCRLGNALIASNL